MRFYETFSLHNNPQSVSATQIPWKAAVISGYVIILDKSRVLCARRTFASVRQQNKEPASKDNHSIEKREKRTHFSRRFCVLWEILCHHMSSSPLSTSILKSPFNSHDHSTCTQETSWGYLLRYPGRFWKCCEFPVRNQRECSHYATFCLLKQLKPKILKSSKLWHASWKYCKETVGSNTTGCHESTVEYTHQALLLQYKVQSGFASSLLYGLCQMTNTSTVL